MNTCMNNRTHWFIYLKKNWRNWLLKIKALSQNHCSIFFSAKADILKWWLICKCTFWYRTFVNSEKIILLPLITILITDWVQRETELNLYQNLRLEANEWQSLTWHLYKEWLKKHMLQYILQTIICWQQPLYQKSVTENERYFRVIHTKSKAFILKNNLQEWF